MFAVVGHIAPIYYQFKGGKGVLSTAVMAAILAPIPFLFLITLFVIIVAISKYVSLGSVVSAIFFPVVLFAYFRFILLFGEVYMPGLASLSTIIIAILIVYCHRGNLQRISDRTERKISFKKKPKSEEAKNDVES
jgi:glycerol-3-phosphate acyltransferase PlsY